MESRTGREDAVGTPASVNSLTVAISAEMEKTAPVTSQVADLADELYSFGEMVRRS
jgi:hypothetical protein